MLCRHVSAKPAEAVHEDDRGPAPFDHIVEAEPVDLAAPKLQFRHGSLILPEAQANKSPVAPSDGVG